MKNLFYSSNLKRLSIGCMATFLCVSSNVYSQWTWQWNGTEKSSFTDMFKATFATPTFAAPTNDDVVDDPTESGTKSYLFTVAGASSATNNTFHYSKSFSDGTKGVTIVMRFKGVNSTNNKIGDFELRINTNLRLRLVIKNGNIQTAYSSEGNTTYSFPKGISALTDYVVLRLAYDNTGYLKCYLNEDPVEFFAQHTGGTSGTGNSFHFGKSSSNNSIGYYEDWIVCDETGVYAPGAGNAIPAEYTKSSMTKLSDITINGTSIPAFEQDTLVYNIGLSPGSAVPSVDATALHRYLGETFTVNNATSIPGTTTIDVTAQNGNKKVYTLNFREGLSTDAAIKSVKVGSTTLAQFVPGTTTYDVKIPSGSTTPVALTCTTNERYATVSVVDATTLPGTGTIVVTAQDGSTQKTYTFNMSAAEANDATLTNIKVNGATISGFDPATLSYNVELPFGTSTIPTVSYTKTDANAAATVVKTDASALPGSTTLLVTAADAVTTKTYTLNFTVSETAGLNSLNAEDVKIFSEPFSSILNLQVPQGLLKGKVFIYNINGALQSETAIDKTGLDINVGKLSPGVYPVKVVAKDGNSVVKKFVKR